MTTDPQDSRPASKKRGVLNPRLVQRFSFAVITMSILVGVVASVLAIWEYTGTEVLWRTVATCAVIAGGGMAFSLVNTLFGGRDE